MAWIEHFHTTNWGQASLIALGAYLLGCFVTGYYFVRMARGEDVREMGSGNPGARNVGRLLGWKAFLATVLGDVGKGMFAVWAASRFTKDDRLVALAMLAVVAGHVWPVQLRFRGGKGIATALGGLLIYDWRLLVSFLVLYAGGVIVARTMVLAGSFALVSLPLAAMYLNDAPEKIVAISIFSGIVLITHRKNMIEEFSAMLERHSIHAKSKHREL